MTSIPGAFNFELTQFGDLERQTGKQPDIQDSGAPMMKVLVRDLDAVVAKAKTANAPIITKGSAPVTAPTPIGTAKAIVMRDPDGYFIEAIHNTGHHRRNGRAAVAGWARTSGATPPRPSLMSARHGLTVPIWMKRCYWNGVRDGDAASNPFADDQRC
jgi:hypothetical protein